MDSSSPDTDSKARVLSQRRSRSKSPLSPSPSEGFHWPDVRELRSKYSLMNSTSLDLPPAGRSRSVPESMSDCGPRRRSSCSSSLVLSSANVDAAVYRSHSRREREAAQVRTHRAGSLDNKLGGLNLSDLQDLKDSGYYVSAQATLPGAKKVIVVEKVPEMAPEVEKREALENPAALMDMDSVDDHYVQIRSPTSREKISIKAVIERCRAYQESEEYRQRDESPSKADRSKETDKASSLESALRNSVDSGKKADASQQGVVKNLREKFLNLK